MLDLLSYAALWILVSIPIGIVMSFMNAIIAPLAQYLATRFWGKIFKWLDERRERAKVDQTKSLT